MHKLIQQLISQGPMLTDGAWGTQFQARGLEPGECPDLWNLAHPDRVEAVARAYVEAGSQIILTNTFRANRIALDRPGVARAHQGNQRAGAWKSPVGRRRFPRSRLCFAGPKRQVDDDG